ncbi:hypothetical protein [uncultured Nitrosomonas sp.]|uniref:hypothetical protein n=1 Tax=uncultured Nitrosomonas sp. TaxID=156424 RepID=UPI0025D34AD8|nr:hypothetical protein [uncultured Nitrosomonas sp.]
MALGHTIPGLHIIVAAMEKLLCWIAVCLFYHGLMVEAKVEVEQELWINTVKTEKTLPEIGAKKETESRSSPISLYVMN